MVLVLVSFAIHISCAEMFVTGWDSVDSKVTMMRGGRPKNCMSIPRKGKIYFSSLKVLTSSRTNPASYTMDTGDNVPGVRAKGREPAEVKNECGYTSCLPYVLMPSTRIHWPLPLPLPLPCRWKLKCKNL